MRKPTGRRDGRPRYALLLGLAACLLCCGKADKDGFAAPPTDELPVYDQQAARIFDDSIAPEVFGLQVERASPTRDSLLRERSQASDYIARVKLRTIREERFDDSLRYRIVVQPLGEPIAGDALPPELELTVGRASPSLVMLRSMSVEAVGASFILLLKRYQLNNEPVLHFRGEPDSAAISTAIQQALVPTP